jgi:hypothetical protein
MWNTRFEMLANQEGIKFILEADSRVMTFKEVIEGLQQNDAFQAWFNAVLASVAYPAFRWETPGVNLANVNQPFEFVVLNSPGLAPHPDRKTFAKHWVNSQSTVVAFKNLGGDATLVVPCPIADDSAYGHLATFVRNAPEYQQNQLWKIVGETMQHLLGDTTIWLSTAGASVSWLHVRLDDRPKYYGFAAYRGKS